MGYKIEIVLIFAAIFLLGVILCIVSFQDNTPQAITIKTVEKAVAVSNSKIDDIDEQNLDKININTASKEELMKLDGIGEVLAQRIIDYRENNDFSAIDEIQNVYGIGKTKFDEIKDKISVN